GLRWIYALGRGPAGSCLQVPPRHFKAAAQQKESTCGPQRQQRRPIRPFEPVVRTIVRGAIYPDAGKGNRGGVAPAAEQRHLSSSMEQARRDKLRLGSFIGFDAVTATDIDVTVG